MYWFHCRWLDQSQSGKHRIEFPSRIRLRAIRCMNSPGILIAPKPAGAAVVPNWHGGTLLSFHSSNRPLEIHAERIDFRLRDQE